MDDADRPDLPPTTPALQPRTTYRSLSLSLGQFEHQGCRGTWLAALHHVGNLSNLEDSSPQPEVCSHLNRIAITRFCCQQPKGQVCSYRSRVCFHPDVGKATGPSLYEQSGECYLSSASSFSFYHSLSLCFFSSFFSLCIIFSLPFLICTHTHIFVSRDRALNPTSPAVDSFRL